MTIARPVAWGRTLAEYRAMFALDSPPAALGPVLDVGAGPASFAAEWVAAGGRAVAADPLYGQDPGWIRADLDAAEASVRRLLDESRDRFVWGHFADPDALVAERRAAAARFLADHASDRRQGRYVAAALPRLPFAERRFALALCSHLLFLYGETLDLDFHRAALAELLRVAREVRVFPLLEMSGAPSRHREPVIGVLEADGAVVQIERVAYMVQRGGDEMLRIR